MFLLLTQICVQKVSASGGNFGDDAFINNGNGAYSIVDASGLPSGTNFYYKYADGYCDSLPANKVITYSLNAVNGIGMATQLLGNFITDYLLYGDFFKTARETVFANFIYSDISDSSTVIGFALNDINGCVYRHNAPSDTEITIPSDITNDVYNYYNDWANDNGLDLPDYININLQKKNWALGRVQANNYAQALTAMINEQADITTFALNNGYINTSNYSYKRKLNVSSGYVYYCDSSSDWLDYCAAMNLTRNNNVAEFMDQMVNNTLLSFKIKDKNTMLDVDITQLYYPKTDGTYSSNTTNVANIGGLGSLGVSDSYNHLTIWKNTDIMNQVINNTYAPSTFYSQRYYDYNSTSTDNSSTTTNNNIDSSVTTNETIYNDSSQSFTDYYSENNYQIDNSVVINDNDTIINNYYPTDNGDDNGGGSGSGGSGSGDDDDGILDKLVDAILGFFKSIGKIIAALIAGLFELLDTILNALADINNSFDGIKNFLASIFSWFPSSIVTLMVLGLGLALLASFITWFKK